MKKTLTSLVLGASLLFPSISKPAVIDVPTGFINLQSYVDMAEPGDTLNIVYSIGNPGVFSSAVINKDLNFEGNGFLLTGMWGNPTLLEIRENAKVNINNMGVYSNGGYSIGVYDNASLYITNSPHLTSPNTIIYFNSTGDMSINNSRFDTFDFLGERKIYLENLVGNISITRNTFVGGETAIYVAQDSGSNLEILNNTINRMTGFAIYFDVPMQATGYIANNSISNCGYDINNLDYLGSIVFTNNNIWNTQDPPSENFYFNPLYVDEQTNDFRLQSNSPLWGRGLDLGDKTPWFSRCNQTWIGAYGENSNVPEPGVVELLAIAGASLGAYALRKKL